MMSIDKKVMQNLIQEEVRCRKKKRKEVTSANNSSGTSCNSRPLQNCCDELERWRGRSGIRFAKVKARHRGVCGKMLRGGKADKATCIAEKKM